MFKVAHIAVVVKDIEKSMEFYCNVLGCEVVGSNKNDRLKFLYLKSGTQIIELLQYLNEEIERSRGVIDHIAFNVPDIFEAINHVNKYGANMLFDSPREVHGKKIIFFTGPDGERIEFIEE